MVWFILLFIIMLAVVVISAEFFLNAAERVGLSLGLSPFIVGVTIVGIGTSLPELATSLIAVLDNVKDVPVASAVGSNVANILLILGISAIMAKRLQATKSLINLDLPLLACATTLFYIVAKDGVVSVPESVFLILTYVIYLIYTVTHREEGEADLDHKTKREMKHARKRIQPLDIVFLVGGILGLVLGSKGLVYSLEKLAGILSIAPGLISITALAFGTSLPELVVAVKAALQRKSEIVMGNIFGSNIFNILMVVGIPGLFGTLSVDPGTLTIGLPMLAAATLLFVISGISKRIHIWEGAFYLILYTVFIGKLFDLL